MLWTSLNSRGRTPFGTPFPKYARSQRSSSSQDSQCPTFLGKISLLKIWSVFADVKNAVFWKFRENVCVDSAIVKQRVEIPHLLSHSIKTDLSESENDHHAQFPVKCDTFQCLICLGDRGKTLLDRLHSYGSKFSMRRHVNNNHKVRPDSCPYPDPATRIIQQRSMGSS